MRRLFYLIPMIVLLAFINEGCKKKDTERGKLTLRFAAKMGSVLLDPSHITYHDTIQPAWIKVEKFQFYISNVTLITIDNKEVKLAGAENVGLFTWADTILNERSFTVPVGNYKAIRLGLGLDPGLNAMEPTSFPDEHPMSYTQNTHWGMASQYVFAKYEGQADTSATASGSLVFPFVYHIGLNENYREFTLSNRSYSINLNDETSLDFDIDLFKILNGGPEKLEVAGSSETHSINKPELAAKIRENLISAFTLR